MTTKNSLHDPAHISAYVSTLLVGGIFGFFYSWICSTMWGLDQADPRVAIAAMQAMNDSVQNPVFMPAFFLTPVSLGVTALLAWKAGHNRSATYFLIAGLLYTMGGIVFTASVNVPMNEELAAVTVPESIEDARRVWQDYSSHWQLANITRTVIAGVCVILSAIGLAALRREPTRITNPPHSQHDFQPTVGI